MLMKGKENSWICLLIWSCLKIGWCLPWVMSQPSMLFHGIQYNSIFIILLKTHKQKHNLLVEENNRKKEN